MEELDQKCPACNGTGRAKSGDQRVDELEHDVARLKWEIAYTTEEYGLDLRHRNTIPGESEARQKVGKLQLELAEKVQELEAIQLAAGGQGVVCQRCNGKGLVLTETGQQLFNFIHRWIHPTS